MFLSLPIVLFLKRCDYIHQPVTRRLILLTMAKNFLKENADMNSCFEGYLTETCAHCEYWKNDKTSLGCASPYPIMECRAFREKLEKEEKNQMSRHKGER